MVVLQSAGHAVIDYAERDHQSHPIAPTHTGNIGHHGRRMKVGIRQASREVRWLLPSGEELAYAWGDPGAT